MKSVGGGHTPRSEGTDNISFSSDKKGRDKTHLAINNKRSLWMQEDTPEF